jgi:predicted metal-dependent phosphoesterase TrpH
MCRSYVDLHVHTIYSDGTFTPAEVVERAEELGLAAVGIADHDSTLGVPEALARAADLTVEVVPAVELSSMAHGLDIHVLGYFIDYTDPGFLEILERIREERYKRAVEMVKKLEDLGVNLSIDEVKARAGKGAVGRPHIAEVMVSNGYVRSSSEAFVRYIGYHSPAYVPKMEMSPKDAFELIRSVGGISVLAHPGTLARDEIILELVTDGLEGIEVWHSKHDASTQAKLRDAARRHGLLVTGGSDCHGCRQDGPLVGTVKVPSLVLEDLKRARENVAAH